MTSLAEDCVESIPWFDADDAEEADDASTCGCRPSLDGDRLLVDAEACSAGGDLVESPPCRAAVVDALADAGCRSVAVRTGGFETTYRGAGFDLLACAGSFSRAVAPEDHELARLARRDPIAAARTATGRAGPVERAATRSGLANAADGVESSADAFDPLVGLQVANARVRKPLPDDGRLQDTRDLPTGATVRRFHQPTGLDCYHVRPPGLQFGADERDALGAARDLVADAAGGETLPVVEAVRRTSPSSVSTSQIARTLEKHTAGLGTIDDLFADDRISDVFVNAPVAAGPLVVRCAGRRYRTNVWLTERGVRAIASRLRLASGTAFSRADPTLDATVDVQGRRVRVGATTDPVSDGFGMAMRAHERERWTLERLVRCETMPADAAALLSVAVGRGAATLIAGSRGAGKTTTLGALLWELDPAVRTLVIEDTRELPVESLRADGRDVQSLLASDGQGPDAADVLRTALRLGDSALVVGEVRGTEAAVLYEAMRVGATGEAVLGTIHGTDGAGVRERVVSDLEVPESAFAATDLVATMRATAGERRRLARLEEVVETSNGVTFEPLFESTDQGLEPTGRVERGNSRLLEDLRRPTERYADLLERLAERAGAIDDRVGPSQRRTWQRIADT